MLIVSPALSVRTSTVDITPPEPLPLGGYTERGAAKFQPGGEPLTARTLLLECEGTKVALVAVEMLTMPESLVAAVQELAPKDVRLVLMATHTHCAPDSQMLNSRMTFAVPGIATFRRRQLEWYAQRIAEGVTAATQAEPKAIDALALAQTKADLNHGRRGAKEVDRVASFLTTPSGEVLLTHFAAHPTLHDEAWMKLSGDWPGEVMRRTGGIVALGPIGDVSPEAKGGDPVERQRLFVDGLLDAKRKAKTATVWREGEPLAYGSCPIELGKATPHPSFAKANKAPDSLAQVLVSRFAPPEAHVQVVEVGGLVLIAIPGEPTAALGRRIQAAARKQGFPRALVMSHAGGWVGYILEPKDYDKGGYEATLAFHGRGLADRVVEAAKKALDQLPARSAGSQTR